MSSTAGSRALPPVDERLVAGETRYEIVDGKVAYVPPALEPHGNRHSKISALVEAADRIDELLVDAATCASIRGLLGA